MAKRSASESPCLWISRKDAFKRFATHRGGTESARHLKPLHWYIACRLVIEGGFLPSEITPRPPFQVTDAGGKRGRRLLLSFDERAGGSGEQIILGGLKTKNVDVVVNKPTLGPVIAISCKGVTKSFRNLPNRMEETIGECTNLHITYPAMVIGYFALLRANRTEEDAKETDNSQADADEENYEGDGTAEDVNAMAPSLVEASPSAVVPPGDLKEIDDIKANDIAIRQDGEPAYGIIRFHDALREMTLRRGLRDEISRYEAMTMVLVEPKRDPGSIASVFPDPDSPLHMDRFFETLYRRYYERFVYGASLLAKRGITPQIEWAEELAHLQSKPARSWKLAGT